MESRKMVLMKLFARNKDRHRAQTWGYTGGRRGWDKLKE